MEQRRLSLNQKTRQETAKIENALFHHELMQTDAYRIVEETIHPAGLTSSFQADLVAIGINKAIWNTK